MITHDCLPIYKKPFVFLIIGRSSYFFAFELLSKFDFDHQTPKSGIFGH
jgi:hypothetical protein